MSQIIIALILIISILDVSDPHCTHINHIYLGIVSNHHCTHINHIIYRYRNCTDVAQYVVQVYHKSKSQSRTKGFFRAIFLDLFLIIFVRAFLNGDLILFYYLPQNVINNFQLKISSTCQEITKFHSKCAKTKNTLCPELQNYIDYAAVKCTL